MTDVAATSTGQAAPPPVGAARRPPGYTLTGAVTWGGLWVFVGGLLLAVASVLLASLTTQLADGWLPRGYTTRWYTQSWTTFGLGRLLVTTVEVGVAVVAVTLAVALPTAYVLARLTFPGRRLLLLLFLVPQVVPVMTYAVPLATLVYRLRLNDTLAGIVLVNLVPAIPFAVLVLLPFVEQVDPRIEQAARVCGATNRRVFVHILGPLLVPGLLAAGVLTLVRVVGQFELTFLVSGPDSQTLVVALYGAAVQAGELASQEINAMATVYMATTLTLLLVALRVVDPTAVAARDGRSSR
ncbi:ABC transporter permease [Micromonospora antibiotica]|uniref:ABC transporter permease subunit n=1 Tax=Micromonospora antibiotica TaxID=2807623 RepID=A0ABS3VFN8_9ACTN|nr:ABC transporter permease subunit [Micromonospora antibiotica]MBO4164438.1 ABC transporter permease subunit [Micromonospora antibiotica]